MILRPNLFLKVRCCFSLLFAFDFLRVISDSALFFLSLSLSSDSTAPANQCVRCWQPHPTNSLLAYRTAKVQPHTLTVCSHPPLPFPSLSGCVHALLFAGIPALACVIGRNQCHSLSRLRSACHLVLSDGHHLTLPLTSVSPVFVCHHHYAKQLHTLILAEPLVLFMPAASHLDFARSSNPSLHVVDLSQNRTIMMQLVPSYLVGVTRFSPSPNPVRICRFHSAVSTLAVPSLSEEWRALTEKERDDRQGSWC